MPQRIFITNFCRLPKAYPLDKLVGLVETSIAKMVPISSQKEMEEDILQVHAETYNTLVLDKMVFKNPIPINRRAGSKREYGCLDRQKIVHSQSGVGCPAAIDELYQHLSLFGRPRRQLA